jgi:hypothetical protein
MENQGDGRGDGSRSHGTYSDELSPWRRARRASPHIRGTAEASERLQRVVSLPRNSPSSLVSGAPWDTDAVSESALGGTMSNSPLRTVEVGVPRPELRAAG